MSDLIWNYRKDLNQRIPVLTMRPTWAWAFHQKVLCFQNRTWDTFYRGPIWLHAALDERVSEYAEIRAQLLDYVDAVPPRQDIAQFYRSRVFGLAVLEGMTDTHGEPAHQWRFHPTIPFMKNFVEWKGHQRLWKLPLEVELRCRKELPTWGLPLSDPAFSRIEG